MSLIFGLYSTILGILYILLYPFLYLFLRARKYQKAMDPRATSSEKGILIHAASVGEVNAVKPLLKALEERNTKGRTVITTTTNTGLELARKLTPRAHLAVLDIPGLRARQLRAIDPRLIIIVETEIWPILLDQAARQGRDVVFVNARISEKTFRRYRRIKPLLKRLQRPIKLILAQTDGDAQRFRQLFSVSVQTAGNLKFSLDLPKYDEAGLREKYGFKQSDFIVCLGSSRPGEEKVFVDIMPELKGRIPNLKYVIAPRHLNRLNEVRALFPGHTLFTESGSGRAAGEVFIVDAMGHLPEFYAFCDIAVVGGSFYDFGGHNPLEPAFYAKPIVMGRHHSSCAGSVQDLQSHSAIQISDINELPQIIIDLHDNPDKLELLGKNALQCVKRNSDSLDNHLGGLKPWLKQ